jgi:hypothetical protein
VDWRKRPDGIKVEANHVQPAKQLTTVEQNAAARHRKPAQFGQRRE